MSRTKDPFKQGSRVRLGDRTGRARWMLLQWREETQRHEYYAQIEWDEGHDTWHWVADLTHITRALGAPRIGRR